VLDNYWCPVINNTLKTEGNLGINCQVALCVIYCACNSKSPS